MVSNLLSLVSPDEVIKLVKEWLCSVLMTQINIYWRRLWCQNIQFFPYFLKQGMLYFALFWRAMLGIIYLLVVRSSAVTN